MKWELVFERLKELRQIPDLWRSGQDQSLDWLHDQLQVEQGVLVADEVGLGKTRLAIALAVCVAHCGGRVAVLMPPGLTFQWRDEELAAFLAQVRNAGVPWLADWRPRTRLLRSYLDLFTADKGFPVSQKGQITFISHTFGLPYTSKAKSPGLWALPFMLKKKFFGGREVWGAGQLDIGEFQRDAVTWLFEQGSSQNKERLAALKKLSPKAFDDDSNRQLFEGLVGQLVGEFDLLVIDEAHKGRAGDDVRDSEKKAETTRVTRLSRLLRNVLLRPEARATRKAKRLALTATPMEMDASQWVAVFNRLGVEAARVGLLKQVVEDYEKAVKGLRVGTADEIGALKSAAQTFQRELAPIVTRRLWRDDETVQRFAKATSDTRSAHPHRRMKPSLEKLEIMTQRDRTYLAHTEALSMAARSAEVAFEVKTTGSRYSQGLPILSESPRVGLPKGADPSRAMRIAYWHKKINEMDQEFSDVSARGRWLLQWHPRVRQAVSLVEELTQDGRKVLVFGEFIESLRALERSLNIRHYLRRLRDQQAVPLPRDVNPGDPDLRRWLHDPEFTVEIGAERDFEAFAAGKSRTYESSRAHLRELCKRAVDKYCKDDELSSELRDTLITWLVQQLCSNELLGQINDSSGDEKAIEAASKLLDNHDPDHSTDEEEAEEKDSSRNWSTTVAQLATDLQTDANGVVFRISPFAQLLIGDTKPATRRARQGAFNNSALNPKVLIGQSAVMSEGLNLHRACRDVVLFHLDWNPGRIEQQIGRVDRQGSDWMVTCIAALDHGRELPTINVHTVAIEGTYDDLRTAVVTERAKVLRSQLFGEIIPAAQLAALSPEVQREIAGIQIDFRPSKSNKQRSPT